MYIFDNNVWHIIGGKVVSSSPEWSLGFCLLPFRTVATWGGSTQCALDEEGDEDGYLSEGVVRTDEEEEEEEQDASSNDNFSMYPPNSMNHNSCSLKETKNRLVLPV